MVSATGPQSISLFRVGEQVISVNHAEHTVVTDKNRTIPYDICVLATGSMATLPPYMSTERAKQTRGVFVDRNIANLEAIITYTEREGVKGRRAAVVGGGLLGLEAAKAVHDLYVFHYLYLIQCSIDRHGHAAQQSLMLPSLIGRSFPFHGKLTATLERWSFTPSKRWAFKCSRACLSKISQRNDLNPVKKCSLEWIDRRDACGSCACDLRYRNHASR